MCIDLRTLLLLISPKTKYTGTTKFSNLAAVSPPAEQGGGGGGARAIHPHLSESPDIIMAMHGLDPTFSATFLDPWSWGGSQTQ